MREVGKRPNVKYIWFVLVSICSDTAFDTTPQMPQSTMVDNE
jgi:hypothetical protein